MIFLITFWVEKKYFLISLWNNDIFDQIEVGKEIFPNMDVDT